MPTVSRAVAHFSFVLVALALAGGCNSNTALGTETGEQSWTGSIENYMFHSGSNALALIFATDAKGVVKGTIVFGMGTPPAPATDPNVGYPPDLLSSTGFASGEPLVGAAYVAEGFPYAFDGGSLSSQRLQIKIDMGQLWDGWCALQTPQTDGSSGCLPNGAPTFDSRGCTQDNFDTGQSDPVDCGKLDLCATPSQCACTSAGCVSAGADNENVFLNVVVTGDTASGTFTQLGTPNDVNLVKN
jgi:hypothetical protein